MAQPLPYGYVWDYGNPNGGIRPARPDEYYNPGSAPTPSPAPTNTPPVINAPPTFLDDNENIYKDGGGVIRNMKQGAPAMSQYPRAGGGNANPNDPNRWAGQGAYGGGGGGGQYSGMGGGSTVTAGGGGFGPGGGGGGGGMAIMQDTRMSSALDPSVWNTPITGGSVNQAAGQAGGYAAGLANLNPSVAAPDRTLYDKYSQFLQGGAAGMANDPSVQFALGRAQQANQRQLAAGRNRNSGRALEEMAATTTGNLMQQFSNLANVYGQGAGMEGQRWQGEQGLSLDAQKLKLAGLQGAGDLAVRSGQLYGQQDATGIAARQLDLDRSKANIQTPGQAQASTLYGQAVSQANAGGAAGYGSFSPSLSQQYLSLTGTPLTLSSTMPTGGQSYTGFSYAPASAPRYY